MAQTVLPRTSSDVFAPSGADPFVLTLRRGYHSPMASLADHPHRLQLADNLHIVGGCHDRGGRATDGGVVPEGSSDFYEHLHMIALDHV